MSKAIIGSLLALTLALPLAGCNKSPSTEAAKAPAGMAAGAEAAAPHPTPAPRRPGRRERVAKAEGGKTVAEVFAEKDALAGKPVTLRGKVVKSNIGIMGKNWIRCPRRLGQRWLERPHRDHDYGQPNVGDTVVITGPSS